MKLDTNRIVRTLIQAASGGAIALLTAITGNFNKDTVVAALVQFASTVAVAVLMNIKKQAEEQSEEDEKHNEH